MSTTRRSSERRGDASRALLFCGKGAMPWTSAGAWAPVHATEEQASYLACEVLALLVLISHYRLSKTAPITLFDDIAADTIVQDGGAKTAIEPATSMKKPERSCRAPIGDLNPEAQRALRLPRLLACSSHGNVPTFPRAGTLTSS